MKKLEITKGEWIIVPTGLDGLDRGYDIVIEENKGDNWGKWIACAQYPKLYDGTIEEASSNAKLISDAGNTYQQCELLPSELLEQNKRLRGALDQFMKYYESDFFRVTAKDGRTLAEWITKANKALKSTE